MTWRGEVRDPLGEGLELENMLQWRMTWRGRLGVEFGTAWGPRGSWWRAECETVLSSRMENVKTECVICIYDEDEDYIGRER